LQQLDLTNNPQLPSPPSDIMSRGVAAVLAFLRNVS
jgi:hypothetical protein